MYRLVVKTSTANKKISQEQIIDLTKGNHICIGGKNQLEKNDDNGKITYFLNVDISRFIMI